jgi:hypothetical protein
MATDSTGKNDGRAGALNWQAKCMRVAMFHVKGPAWMAGLAQLTRCIPPCRFVRADDRPIGDMHSNRTSRRSACF